MRPTLPMKRYALGMRTTSKLNPSFNTLFFICKETWDSKEEAEEYIKNNPTWKKNEHSMSTILILTQEEIDTYSR
jgi:hypothetical protein